MTEKAKPITQRVHFEFTEASLRPIPAGYKSVPVRNPQTGEVRYIMVPEYRHVR